LYEILGVESTCSPQELRRAYLLKARSLHPDKNPSPDAKQQFQSLSRAYEILSDPEQRNRYDTLGVAEDELSPEDAFAEYLRKFTEASVTQQDIEQQIEREKLERAERESGITEEEEGKLIELYNKYEGKMNTIMQFVLCSKKQAMAFLQKCLDKGELKELKHWKKPAANNKRKRGGK
jgi:DnaJ-class molecular chaperone